MLDKPEPMLGYAATFPTSDNTSTTEKGLPMIKQTTNTPVARAKICPSKK